MAWTTTSPIRGNHWVPLGCRALLGSVKLRCWHPFTLDAFKVWTPSSMYAVLEHICTVLEYAYAVLEQGVLLTRTL
jgi:hypothetical protein